MPIKAYPPAQRKKDFSKFGSLYYRQWAAMQPFRSQLKDGLVAFWKCEEASGDADTGIIRADSSLNGLDLTCDNAPRVDGVVGYGLSSRDSLSSVIKRAHSAELNLGKQATWSFWLKKLADSTSRTYLSKWNWQTDGGWAIRSDATAGAQQIHVYLATSAADDGSGANAVTTNAGLTTGEWALVTVRFDSAKTGNDRLTIYINGYPRQVSYTGAMPDELRVNATAELRVGTWQNMSASWCSADFDEIGIWNRALLETEVHQLWNYGRGNNKWL